MVGTLSRFRDRSKANHWHCFLYRNRIIDSSPAAGNQFIGGPPSTIFGGSFENGSRRGAEIAEEMLK
jgi:hypothetical protein